MTANSTKVNSAQIRQYIQDFRFEDLFIEELGWDQYRDQLEVVVEGDNVTLHAFAQKRGMVVFTIAAIPAYKLRRKIEQQVAKAHRENIIIYTDPHQTQQVWQWVRREMGKPLANRERQFTRGQSGEHIAQILGRIAVRLEEEDNLTIVDMTSRVRAAFDLEKVTKKFYDRFKKQHDAFLKFIAGIPDADLQRWYASVMLNRLMFIYFVQRKGFLNNDLNYLRNRLVQTDGNFYRDFLIPLFFQGFAQKHHPPEVRRLLGVVPYLNGGLFLQHQIEKWYGEAIQIENEAFERLFDFFNEYDWHLDERPLHNDNEINPDVLGYIFEKYINQKQMGAYYTKEDITEYISKHTVIPFLFDAARKAVKIAFAGEHTVWDVLVEDPDRYIYPAVRHGTARPLPEHIAVGLDDVSQRGDWNTPTPPEYGLPTEIWRETVARRTRYADVRGKLERGEVRQINDLITFNLDIQQFAQDVIDFTDSPDVIRAFWHAINQVTVLDPTCGSGAFLFAALNILEPLYEACLERMEAFLVELDRTGGEHPQKYSDFREVMARIDQHPNRRYFILKSIIIQNLYGVDIMEEAVEIAKLRLFLKLVAQVEDQRRIEPLPDIDFNIRAGNTLVGFATQEEVRQAMATTSAGQVRLLFGEDQDALAAIERKAQDIDQLFERFRQQQTAVGGEVDLEDKAEIQQGLRALEEELNRLLARQYDIDTTRSASYNKWLKSHRPFHWFVEFYGVLKNGGFDVIIGNPPYVEYHKIRKHYTILNYSTEKCGNLYAYVIEVCNKILREAGRMGMIVQMSAICTDRMEPLQDLYRHSSRQLWASSFDDRPAKLFDGLEHIRAAIIINEKGAEDRGHGVLTTNLNRWYSDTRQVLFANLAYKGVDQYIVPGSFPKMDAPKLGGIIAKLRTFNNTVNEIHDDRSGRVVHYHRSPLYWIRSQNFMPHFTSKTAKRSMHHFKDFGLVSEDFIPVVGSIINSSLFYIWFIVIGNGRNVAIRDITSLPVPPTLIQSDNGKDLKDLVEVFDQLMDDYEENSIIRKRKDGVEYQEFYPSQSKHIIDEIDRVLARHYGFTDEELDFIINYDIKYRMGDNLFEESEEAS